MRAVRETDENDLSAGGINLDAPATFRKWPSLNGQRRIESAAAYSLLAYQTAWLKAHYAAEFFAANMSVEIDNSDKLKALAADARTFGVTIETPDINAGTYRFEPLSQNSVRFGLGSTAGR
mgnify:CR=1 FL=1